MLQRGFFDAAPRRRRHVPAPAPTPAPALAPAAADPSPAGSADADWLAAARRRPATPPRLPAAGSVAVALPPRAMRPIRQQVAAMVAAGRPVPEELVSPSLQLAGLASCECHDAPAERRASLLAAVVAAYTPARAEQRLAVLDLDAGRLQQTAMLLTGLHGCGWRRFDLALTDPHYPAAMAGAYRLVDGEWQHRAAADGVGAYLAANDPNCDRQAALALRNFLEAVGMWCAHPANLGLDVRVAAFRSLPGYLAARGRGALPAPALLLGVDVLAPTPAHPSVATQVGGRDGIGRFELLLPPGAPPVLERQCPTPAPGPGSVEALLARLDGAPAAALISAVRRAPFVHDVVCRDNGVVRLAAAAAQAAPGARAFLLWRQTLVAAAASDWASADGLRGLRATLRARTHADLEALGVGPRRRTVLKFVPGARASAAGHDAVPHLPPAPAGLERDTSIREAGI